MPGPGGARFLPSIQTLIKRCDSQSEALQVKQKPSVGPKKSSSCWWKKSFTTWENHGKNFATYWLVSDIISMPICCIPVAYPANTRNHQWIMATQEGRLHTPTWWLANKPFQPTNQDVPLCIIAFNISSSPSEPNLTQWCGYWNNIFHLSVRWVVEFLQQVLKVSSDTGTNSQ